MTKERIFKIIEKGKKGDSLSILFDYSIIILISLNAISIILESFDSINKNYSNYLRAFEIFSVIIFTIEYVLRIWSSDLQIHNKGKIKSRISFFFKPMSLIDLFAILPFYLPMIIPFDLRILRLTRMLRLFKIQRYSKSLNIISNVLKNKKEELFITIFTTFLLILVSSTLIYYLEHEAQPKQFPNIVQAFWWAIATLTTVGYGDVYPITAWGQLLSGFIALLGIGLVALPTGIISSSFIEELNKRKKKIAICPHCGKEIEK